MGFAFFASKNFAIVVLQTLFPPSCMHSFALLADAYRKRASNRTLNEAYLHLTLKVNLADVIAKIIADYCLFN